ncbi:tRNA preQ1(34) S-adenosylmethionine ribosyltransferase-isomerase QueA [Megalodesulfovibrio paquesii]
MLETDLHAAAAEDPLRLSAYDFFLPEASIAQYPPASREQARLLVCNRAGSSLAHHSILHLPDLLPPESILVVNNSKVARARLHGAKETGGRVECLLLTPLPLLEQEAAVDKGGWKTAQASALLRAAKRPRAGQLVRFSENLTAEMLQEGEFGMADVLLRWQGALEDILEQIGELPLPPYLERAAEATDQERYQTIYARNDKLGSVAAPTAGLHMTPAIRQACLDKGMTWVEATLHVGYGTFSPVRVDNISAHAMHHEFVELSADAAGVIARAKREGRPIVAIGTTSCRILEGVWQACGELRGHAGWTNIFLYPGKELRVVDHMITNFHLPRSTLFMLVCAMAGTSFMKQAYAEAIAAGYRFYSYGDAMCIL